MDSEKILKGLLAKQGIDRFFPIVNSDNHYGYLKDGSFVICDGNLNPLPYKNKNIIVKTDLYSCNYEICDECLSDQYSMVVDKSGQIISHVHTGAKRLGDGTIVIGHSYNVLDLKRPSVLNIRNVYIPYCEADDEQPECIIDDNGICKDYCLVAETPRYDIFVKVSEGNKGAWWKERGENRCFIKDKEGMLVAEKTCSFVWVHTDNSLDLISSLDGRKLDILKVDFGGNLRATELEIQDLYEHEEYRLTLANEYDNNSEEILCSNEFLSDNYLVMESVRLNGISAEDFEVFVLHCLDQDTSEPKLTKSVCRDKRGDYGGEYIYEISNNVLKIKHYCDYPYYTYYTYYDVSDMERLDGPYYDRDSSDGDYIRCHKKCGNVTLYGVMGKSDCSLVVPICFHEIEIVSDLCIVTIKRTVDGKFKNDIGIYASDRQILPIGMCDSYKTLQDGSVEYTHKGKYGIVINHSERQYDVFDAKYDEITYHYIKPEDEPEIPVSAFTRIGNRIGYVHFGGYSQAIEIKATHDNLEKLNGSILLADGKKILYINHITGNIECLLVLDGHKTLLARKMPYYALKDTQTGQLTFLEINGWLDNITVTQWPFREMNGFVRLDDGAVFVPTRGKFVCKIKEYEPLYPPEELNTLKEILEWDADTPDVDNKEDEENDSHYYDESPSYSRYGGYNGYDDDTIDSAFEGDPDATWNID